MMKLSEARKPTDDQNQPTHTVRMVTLGETEAGSDVVAEAEKQPKNCQDDGARPAPKGVPRRGQKRCPRRQWTLDWTAHSNKPVDSNMPSPTGGPPGATAPFHTGGVEETAGVGRTRWWLFWVVLLGLGLRLTGLVWGQAYCYFGQGDGIEAYSVAVDYGRGEAHARYLGQPNYNAHSKLPGPLWTLFCFTGLRLGGSIEGVVLAVILLNTITIYLIFLLAERTLGPPGAKWAALFAATSPWAVYYSSGVYNPDVMAFLGSLLFLALWEVTRRDRARSIFGVGFVLLLMPQFHMSGLMLIPAVVLVLLLTARRLNWPWLAGGLLAGAALYGPYLVGEVAQGWPNTRGMMSGQGGYSWDGLKALTAPLNFLVSWAPRWTRSAAEYRELGRACFGSFALFLVVNLLSGLVAALLVFGAFSQIRAGLRGAWRTPRQAFARAPGVLFLAILLVVPLAFAVVSGKSFHSRYCIVLLPPLFCLAGRAAEHWRHSPRLGRYFVSAVAVTTAANVWLMPAMYFHQGQRIDHGAGFVPSFRQLESVYQQLKRHAGGDHGVQVADAPYLKALGPGETAQKDAELIRRYVGVREQEAAMMSGPPLASVTYILRRADQVAAEDPATAYRGHGIALVATPAAP